jgi:hypothetical protein
VGRAFFILALAASALAPPPAAGQTAPRSLADRPDASPHFQVHVIYAVPSDGRDRALDTGGQIARSLETANRWFAEESGGARLRFDRTADGQLDVSFLRLSRAAAELKAFKQTIRGEIEREINAAGFHHPRKIYLVYYDGPHARDCGSSPWPPKLLGNAAVLYLLTEFENKAVPPCRGYPFRGDAPGFWENAAVHEILHALGFAAACARNRGDDSHVTDDRLDLLYGGSRPPGRRKLDVGRDDYFRHGIPGCPDLARSAFLDPLPANAEPPPAWPEGKRCVYHGYGKRTCE